MSKDTATARCLFILKIKTLRKGTNHEPTTHQRRTGARTRHAFLMHSRCCCRSFFRGAFGAFKGGVATHHDGQRSTRGARGSRCMWCAAAHPRPPTTHPPTESSHALALGGYRANVLRRRRTRCKVTRKADRTLSGCRRTLQKPRDSSKPRCVGWSSK